MAKDTQLSNLAVNTEADALAALASGGKVCVYTTPKPATADIAVTSQLKIAQLTLNTPAFGAAIAGLLTATIPGDGVVLDDGVAAWFRVFKADGSTVLWDGTCGVTGANMNLAQLTFVKDQLFTFSSFTHQVYKAIIGL